MTRKNLPIAFYLLLVFVSGSVVGALGYRTYNPPTARGSAPPAADEWRRTYIAETRSRLSLSDGQVAKLNTLLDQADVRFREVHQRDNQLIRQIKDDYVVSMRLILTPEQLPKFEKLRQEREAKYKAEDKEQDQK
jgi:hypothetical protein